MRKSLLFGIVALVAACGDDDGSATGPDAAPGIDAASPVAMVSTVSCAGVTPAVTVATTGFAFTPRSSTITVGQIVKFTMPADHDAKSTATPALWHAMFSGDTCVKFDSAGTFEFLCVPHRFTGTIVVN